MGKSNRLPKLTDFVSSLLRPKKTATANAATGSEAPPPQVGMESSAPMLAMAPLFSTPPSATYSRVEVPCSSAIAQSRPASNVNTVQPVVVPPRVNIIGNSVDVPAGPPTRVEPAPVPGSTGRKRILTKIRAALHISSFSPINERHRTSWVQKLTQCVKLHKAHKMDVVDNCDQMDVDWEEDHEEVLPSYVRVISSKDEDELCSLFSRLSLDLGDWNLSEPAFSLDMEVGSPTPGGPLAPAFELCPTVLCTTAPVPSPMHDLDGDLSPYSSPSLSASELSGDLFGNTSLVSTGYQALLSVSAEDFIAAAVASAFSSEDDLSSTITAPLDDLSPLSLYVDRHNLLGSPSTASSAGSYTTHTPRTPQKRFLPDGPSGLSDCEDSRCSSVDDDDLDAFLSIPTFAGYTSAPDYLILPPDPPASLLVLDDVQSDDDAMEHYPYLNSSATSFQIDFNFSAASSTTTLVNTGMEMDYEDGSVVWAGMIRKWDQTELEQMKPEGEPWGIEDDGPPRKWSKIDKPARTWLQRCRGRFRRRLQLT